jgi:predicted Abi (CAAX) family protease
LVPLVRDLERALQPWGRRPPEGGPEDEFVLGSTLEDEPLRNLVMGLGSWRTLLPRKASDVVARILLGHGADLWGLRTNQVGGEDAEIRPIPPVTF